MTEFLRLALDGHNEKGDLEKIVTLGEKKVIEKKKLEFDLKDLENEEQLISLYQKYLKGVGKITLESVEGKCASAEQIRGHLDRAKNIFVKPDRVLVTTGDLPVYLESRKHNNSVLSNFHVKLNLGKAVFGAAYSLIERVKGKYWSSFQRKDLRKIEAGYWKLCERMMLNVLAVCAALLVEIAQGVFGKGGLTEVRLLENVDIMNKEENNEKLKNLNVSRAFLKDLCFFVLHLGFSFYFFRLSVNTKNFNGYLASIKLMLSWCLSTSQNSSCSNYARGFSLFLFDVNNIFSSEMVKLIKNNFHYVSWNNRLLDFDEEGEIENGFLKPKHAGKSKTPSKVIQLSILSGIIHFSKEIFNARKTTSNQEKVNHDFLKNWKREDLGNDNFLVEFEKSKHTRTHVLEKTKENICKHVFNKDLKKLIAQRVRKMKKKLTSNAPTITEVSKNQ